MRSTGNLSKAADVITAIGHQSEGENLPWISASHTFVSATRDGRRSGDAGETNVSGSEWERLKAAVRRLLAVWWGWVFGVAENVMRLQNYNGGAAG